jgi:hypothetical protein
VLALDTNKGEIMNKLSLMTTTMKSTEEMKSTWSLLWECKILIAGHVGIAKVQLENCLSDFSRGIVQKRIDEAEQLMADIREKMDTL